ncbi:solute carrier family 28 member 3-like [Ptychodera flava]|uniref:solute carrier family 28 member 3-like n=1 Tax=Ptychodera flava TaxID=63121 RepID=UPI00396A624C
MEKTGSGNDFELIPQNDNSKIDVTEGKQHNVGQPINEAMASEVIDIDGKDESSDGDDDDDDDDDGSNIVSDPDNCFSKKVRKVQTSIYGFFHKYKRQMKIGLYAILLILYTVYFGYAMYYSFKNAIALFAMTVFAVLCVAYMFAKKYLGDKIKEVYQPIIKFVDKHWNIVRWLSAIVTAVLVIIWIIMDTSQNPENLMSLIGVFAILLFCFLFSKHPDKVRWRPVIWGLVLQILFALMILRTRWGVVVFRYLGDHVTVFLEYTQIGAKFVFGDLWKNHYFAFEVMPMVLYLAAVISFLYHIGVIQIVITKLAWILQFTMHTSASESLATAAAIFLSMVEAPMLVGPYMSTMTVSELHAVATAGYTTIAGSIFGAAISFGISPSHVITASVMSAPAALAVSKLFYPETEKEPSSRRYKSLKINLPKYQNAIEALAQGAMKCVPVVVNVCVNFIVILAVLAFLNACLSWAGSMVGHPEFSFELICSWVFMPVAYLMGVDGKDCS